MGVEGSFRVLVPGDAVNAQISGRVDRLEKTEDGRYVIVDLKTGKTKPNKNQIAEHAQLAAYQVAVEAGAGDAMSRDFGVEHDGLDMPAGLERREAAPQRFEVSRANPGEPRSCSWATAPQQPPETARKSKMRSTPKPVSGRFSWSSVRRS